MMKIKNIFHSAQQFATTWGYFQKRFPANFVSSSWSQVFNFVDDFDKFVFFCTFAILIIQKIVTFLHFSNCCKLKKVVGRSFMLVAAWQTATTTTAWPHYCIILQKLAELPPLLWQFLYFTALSAIGQWLFLTPCPSLCRCLYCNLRQRRHKFVLKLHLRRCVLQQRPPLLAVSIHGAVWWGLLQCSPVIAASLAMSRAEWHLKICKSAATLGNYKKLFKAKRNI